MRYNHFTIEEREAIQEILWQKSSIRTIAGALKGMRQAHVFLAKRFINTSTTRYIAGEKH